MINKQNRIKTMADIDAELDQLCYAEGVEAFGLGKEIPTRDAGYDEWHIKGYNQAKRDWLTKTGLANPGDLS